MKKLFLLLLMFMMSFPVYAEMINGAGATFPYPVYSSWAYLYQKDNKVRVNYQSIGSGGGIKQITAGIVDFGASDEPLSQADLDKSSLMQFPAIAGGIVVAVNVDGLKSSSLVMNGKILADIYMGKITEWSDPAIAELNKGVNLPKKQITVIRRSDSSGTTAVFTKYLSECSSDWKKELGSGKSINWKTGIGAKGNAGVTNLVKQTRNSIGYTEYTYAEQAKLNCVKLMNKSGNIVEAGIESFSKAVSSADWSKGESYGISLTNSADAGAWPITAASFILVRKDKPEVSAKVMKFIKYSFEKGDETAKVLKYVPLSTELKTEILNKVKF